MLTGGRVGCVAERLRAIRVAVEEISSSPNASGSAEPEDRHVARADFNVEESGADHRSELLATADVQNRFRSFLAEFWKLSRQSGRIRFIREIDGMLPRIFRPEHWSSHRVRGAPSQQWEVH
jgi:hypothetical protein